MSHYFFPKISENTLHMYKLKVKKFQHASINHKKVIEKKPTGGVNLPPPPMHNRVKSSELLNQLLHTLSQGVIQRKIADDGNAPQGARQANFLKTFVGGL